LNYKPSALPKSVLSANYILAAVHRTFISDDEITSLMDKLRQHFYLLEEDKGDYSIEIDPREVTPAKIVLLRQLGFNRMSFGVAKTLTLKFKWPLIVFNH